MNISLTYTDCRALAVTEAVVAQHLGLEGVRFFQTIDLINKNSCNRTVKIRTHEFHQNPSQKFVVEVMFFHDDDYEHEAELYQNGCLLKKFSWDHCGSKITLMENSD